MPDEINFDVENATETTNGKAIEITTIDYSPEWKTVNCLDQAMKDLESINTTYEDLLTGIASHIAELNSISDVDTPDVPKTSDNVEEATGEPEVLDETLLEEHVEETTTEEEGEVECETKESEEVQVEETEEQSTPEESEKTEEHQESEQVEETPQEEQQPETKPEETSLEEESKTEEGKEEEKNPEEQTETVSGEEGKSYPEEESQQESKQNPEGKRQDKSFDRPKTQKTTPPQSKPKIVDTAVVKSEYAQFKLTSDPNDTNVFYLKEGTSITVVDFNETNGLIKVQLSDGQEGWMTPQSLNLKSDAVEISKAYVNINVTKPVEMKFGTTENSPVIATLEHSKELSVIGIDSEKNMVKIRLESGIEGYVSAEYLQLRTNS